MVEIKFVGTPEEVKQEALRLFGLVNGATERAAKERTLDEVKQEVKQEATRLLAEKVETEKTKGAPKEKEASKPAHESKSTPVPPEADDVLGQMQGALAALVKAKGRSAVESLFKQHGVTRGSEIKPENRLAFIADAKAQLG